MSLHHPYHPKLFNNPFKWMLWVLDNILDHFPRISFRHKRMWLFGAWGCIVFHLDQRWTMPNLNSRIYQIGKWNDNGDEFEFFEPYTMPDGKTCRKINISGLEFPSNIPKESLIEVFTDPHAQVMKVGLDGLYSIDGTPDFLKEGKDA